MLKVGVLLEMIDRISSPVRQMSRQFKKNLAEISKSAKKLGQDITALGKNISLKVTAPLSALGFIAVKTAASFEDYGSTLKTITGSQEAAKKAFDDLLEFTSTTPFQLDEVIGGFIKLKSRGLDPSQKALKSYGNTASAMGMSLDQMIEAIADASTGEFERLKEFGITASSQGNKVAFTFQGTTTVIKKSSKEIQKYLLQIGDLNFDGAMLEKMKNMNGVFSNLKDTVTQSLNILGLTIIKNLDLKNVIKNLSTKIIELTKWFKKLSKPMQKFIIWGGLILTVLGPALIVLGQMIVSFLAIAWLVPKVTLAIATFVTLIKTAVIPALIRMIIVIKSLGIALLTTPIGWFILAVTAIAGAAFLVWKNWDKFKKFFLDMWVKIKNVVKSTINSLMPIIDKFTGAIDSIVGGVKRVGNFVFGENDKQNNSKGYAPAIGTALGSRLVAAQQQIDTGGTLHIKIDQDSKVRVLEAKTNDVRQNYEVDTGLLMGGF